MKIIYAEQIGIRGNYLEIQIVKRKKDARFPGVDKFFIYYIGPDSDYERRRLIEKLFESRSIKIKRMS